MHASKQQILIQTTNEKWSLCVREGSYTIPDSNEAPWYFTILIFDWWGSMGKVAIRNGPFNDISIKGSWLQAQLTGRTSIADRAAAKHQANPLQHWLDDDFPTLIQMLDSRSVSTNYKLSCFECYTKKGTPGLLMGHGNKWIGETKGKPIFSSSLCN